MPFYKHCCPSLITMEDHTDVCLSRQAESGPVGIPSTRRDRTGTPPHQHAILLHELADLMRWTVGTDLMAEHEVRQALDSMRAWMARNAPRLLDDSRALHTLLEARRAASSETEAPDA